jgi:hypothetical protein
MGSGTGRVYRRPGPAASGRAHGPASGYHHPVPPGPPDRPDDHPSDRSPALRTDQQPARQADRPNERTTDRSPALRTDQPSARQTERPSVLPSDPAAPADPLELLRASSGLSVDGEGRFLHRGEPITHARTLEVLWRSLAPTPDGRWQVRVGRETAYVEVDETPWAVRGVRAEGTPAVALTLLLAGGAEVPLDPATLHLGAGGVLRCHLPDGALARFTRAGQVALGALLEEDLAGRGALTLLLAGVRHRVAGGDGA